MKKLFCVLSLLLLVSGCSQVQLASHVTKQAMPPSKSQGTFKVGTPYKIAGKRYYPSESYNLTETGIASWYGPNFHGKSTANGETFDRYELTAAHRTLQMPSLVRVTNLDNGRSLIVRVNDRGPYKRGRIIDVSERAAELLGFKGNGTAKVKLEVLQQESLKIAEMAKQGVDTAGYEVALNQGKRPPRQAAPQRPPTQVASAQAPSSYGYASTAPAAGARAVPPEPVRREALMSAPLERSDMNEVVPGHTKNGAFYPDPIVMEVPVTPSDIYVQAGSFTVADNAYRLSRKLGGIAQAKVYPAMVGGREFFRVRLGPVSSVDQADRILDRLVAAGNNNAIIVVE